MTAPSLSLKQMRAADRAYARVRPRLMRRALGVFVTLEVLMLLAMALVFSGGAKAAEPERTVWAIDGDGCFQMTNQELATCVVNNIPIKVAIINNSSLGMVRQWQTLFYNQRYSNTDLQTTSDRVPDFVKLGEAYGCLALRAETREDVDAVIKQALETNDRPVVIDFVVHRDAMVWPMVPAGVSNDMIQIARDEAPVWDREEDAS